MRQDARVECGTDDHESIRFLAYFLIAIWPLGSLLLYGSLLIPCYKPLQAKTPTALTRATAFLHREYELTFYWWEALELARKLTLTGAVLLIEEQRAFLRLLVATVICSVYAVGLAIVRPYKRVEDTLLAVVHFCSPSPPPAPPMVTGPVHCSRSGRKPRAAPLFSLRQLDHDFHQGRRAGRLRARLRKGTARLQ